MIGPQSEGWTQMLSPLKRGGGQRGAGLEQRVMAAVRQVLAGRGFSDDRCIVHPRSGDEELFEDWRDFIDSLNGYVILPVEEYSKLGGKDAV